MRDYGVSVLEQYPIEVKNVRRVRGAVLCEAEQGLYLLKEAQIREKRLPFLIELYKHLEEAGMKQVDAIVANKEGEYISAAEDETKYILKRWFHGKECDVNKENELLTCVHALGRLHKVLRIQEKEEIKSNDHDIREEYASHNRELRKVNAFVKKRSVKGSFEQTFLKGFDQMYHYAQQAEELLGQSIYEQRNAIVHGEYNYHNLLLGSEGLAITGFERAHYGVQLEDLYYFMRKILEKHQYDERIGYHMLHAYDSEISLDKEKREYLAIRFAYPEKFWKISNMYLQSNKAWIPEKNTEKLKKAIEQAEEKKRFLGNIFAFYL